MAFDVDEARVDIVLDEMMSIGPRRKIAVIAARRTERNVYVHAEVHGLIVARTFSGSGEAALHDGRVARRCHARHGLDRDRQAEHGAIGAKRAEARIASEDAQRHVRRVQRVARDPNLKTGLGVALVPRLVLTTRPRLLATPLAPPGVSRTIALAHRREHALVHAAQELERTLLDHLAEADAAGTLANGVRLVNL